MKYYLLVFLTTYTHLFVYMHTLGSMYEAIVYMYTLETIYKAFVYMHTSRSIYEAEHAF